MVVAETLASLNAVKTAFDMAKALQNIHDATARDRAVIDLQCELLLAQEQQFALPRGYRNCKKRWPGLKRGSFAVGFLGVISDSGNGNLVERAVVGEMNFHRRGEVGEHWRSSAFP